MNDLKASNSKFQTPKKLQATSFRISGLRSHSGRNRRIRTMNTSAPLTPTLSPRRGSRNGRRLISEHFSTIWPQTTPPSPQGRGNEGEGKEGDHQSERLITSTAVGVHASACGAKRHPIPVAADVRRIGAPKRCGVMPSNSCPSVAARRGVGQVSDLPVADSLRARLSETRLSVDVGRLKLNQPEGLKESVAGGTRSATPGIVRERERTPEGCQKRRRACPHI